jgi:hypothetical protein
MSEKEVVDEVAVEPVKESTIDESWTAMFGSKRARQK